MPQSSVYKKCPYIKRDGTACGKGSVTGLCGVHSRCNPQRHCGICGRGTQSATGVCSAEGPCRTAQHMINQRLLAAEKSGKIVRAAPPLPAVKATDLDALVDTLADELLATT